jgi:hypothetical protein
VSRDLKDAPLSTLVAVKGIKSSDNLIEFLSAMMADITVGAITSDDAMACLSVADKMLDVARFSLQNSSSVKSMGTSRPLTLDSGD